MLNGMNHLLEQVSRHLAWTRGDGPDADVALTTRVRLARNLDGFPFPSHAAPLQLKKVMEKIAKAVEYIDRDRSLLLFPLENTHLLHRLVLYERHLASNDHLADVANRTLILSQTGAVSLMLNEEDHLRIQCILSGLCTRATWSTVDRFETLLSEELDFAYQEPHGFLTSYLTNVGTGMRVSVMVHLPALAMEGRLASVLEAAAVLGTTVRGIYGEGSPTMGNLYQISNSITLGLPEEEILARVSTIARHLIREEREARNTLLHENRIEIEDQIFRSYGILTHCRKISSLEATNHLSLIRLGVDLNLISHLKLFDINELLLAIRPGWLQLSQGHTMSPMDRDIQRAALIRKSLMPVE